MKLCLRKVWGGSKIPYFVRRVNIAIEDKKFETSVMCALSDDVPFLLGRESFNGTVCFNEIDRKSILMLEE